MLRTIIVAALAACGVQPTPPTIAPAAEQPDGIEPAEPPVKPVNQHWCCDSIDHKNKTGEGCDPISGSLETIAACNKVLYRSGDWTKDDGTVRCL